MTTWAEARSTHPVVNLERAAHLWELYVGLIHLRNHRIETGPQPVGYGLKRTG